MSDLISKLRLVSEKIAEPLREYQDVPSWAERVDGLLAAREDLSEWRTKFDDIRDQLGHLPAPSLAESWDVFEFEQTFRRGIGVIQSAIEFLLEKQNPTAMSDSSVGLTKREVSILVNK